MLQCPEQHGALTTKKKGKLQALTKKANNVTIS
jgi:hypothetical protein